MKIHPRAAPAELRRRNRWLGIFRFFVRYFPDDKEVLSTSVYNRDGKLLY